MTEIPVDARVAAATNRDLEADVVAGKFRQDLCFRLSVFVIQLPPLRNRQEDIPLLAEHLLKENRGPLGAREMGFAAGALAKLATYDWPGNVRELDNVIQRAIILAPGDETTPDLLVLGKVRTASREARR